MPSRVRIQLDLDGLWFSDRKALERLERNYSAAIASGHVEKVPEPTKVRWKRAVQMHRACLKYFRYSGYVCRLIVVRERRGVRRKRVKIYASKKKKLGVVARRGMPGQLREAQPPWQPQRVQAPRQVWRADFGAVEARIVQQAAVGLDEWFQAGVMLPVPAQPQPVGVVQGIARGLANLGVNPIARNDDFNDF